MSEYIENSKNTIEYLRGVNLESASLERSVGTGSTADMWSLGQEVDTGELFVGIKIPTTTVFSSRTRLRNELATSSVFSEHNQTDLLPKFAGLLTVKCMDGSDIDAILTEDVSQNGTLLVRPSSLGGKLYMQLKDAFSPEGNFSDVLNESAIESGIYKVGGEERIKMLDFTPPPIQQSVLRRGGALFEMFSSFNTEVGNAIQDLTIEVSDESLLGSAIVAQSKTYKAGGQMYW